MALYSLGSVVSIMVIANAALAFNETLVKEGLQQISSEAVEVTSAPMVVEGSMPEWLNGRYYRNGPGKFEVTKGTGMKGGQHVRALFDGYAVVNMFHLNGREKKASRTTKFLRSPRYQQVLNQGNMDNQGKLMLGTMPERHESMNPMNLGGEFSVNFIKLGMNSTNVTHLLAAGELAYMMEFDPESLETIDGRDKGIPTMSGNFFKYDDDISELGMGSAHPIVMPNGDMYTKTSTVEVLSMGSVNAYNVLKIKAGSTKRELVASHKEIDLGITYAHSFAMPSAKYAVLPFWPLFMEKSSLFTKNNLVDGFQFKPSQGTSMVVLDLESGHTTHFKCNETFFGFHFVNSWVETLEDGHSEIVADLVTEPDDAIFQHLMWEKFQNGSNIDHMSLDGVLKRLRIPLSGMQAGSVVNSTGTRYSSSVATITILSSMETEAPRINDAFYGNGSYRYVYGWHATRKGNHPNAIIRFDLHEGTTVLWVEEGDEFGVMMGEPVFIAAPSPKLEDDGVLITAGLHIRSHRAFVLVLDASSMKELARVYHEDHITFGFHSIFIPDPVNLWESSPARFLV